MSTESPSLSVLVYATDAAVRDAVRMAVGRRPAADLGRITYVECEGGEDVVAKVDAGGLDLCVLDGEAWPTGGMGLSRQLKNEIAESICPPMLLLVGRSDDAWLATWSQADAVVTHPIDAVELAAVVTRLLRARGGLVVDNAATP